MREHRAPITDRASPCGSEQEYAIRTRLLVWISRCATSQAGTAIGGIAAVLAARRHLFDEDADAEKATES